MWRKKQGIDDKLALVLCFAHNMGDGRVFHREVQALLKAGWQVRMVARPCTSGTAESRSTSFSVTALPVRPSSVLGRLLIDPFHFAVLVCRAIQCSRGVSVVHCHEFQSLKAGRWIARLRGAKLVYDCHEYQPESLAEIFFGWSVTWSKMACRFFSWTEKRSMAGVDAVVTVNEDLAERFRKYGKKVVVLPNYPDADCIEQSDEPSSAIKERCVGKRVLVFCGYLAPDRGLERCIQALAQLKDRYPDLIFLLVGGGNEAYRRRLADAAREARVLDRTVFTGYVPYDQLVGYIKLGNIGVNLIEPLEKNLRAEQTKCFQYAAASLPVVLSDLPALKKIAKDMGNGIAVPDCDVKAVADAVCDLLSHPEKTKGMGAKGRQAFMSNYNFQAVSGRLIHLYDELIRP